MSTSLYRFAGLNLNLSHLQAETLNTEGVFIKESKHVPGTLGLYAGRSFQADEYITEYGGVGMDKSDAKKLEESEKGYIHDWGEGKVRDGSPCAAHIHTAFPSALWSLLESPSAHAEVTRRLSNDVLTTGCGYNTISLKKVKLSLTPGFFHTREKCSVSLRKKWENALFGHFSQKMNVLHRNFCLEAEHGSAASRTWLCIKHRFRI